MGTDEDVEAPDAAKDPEPSPRDKRRWTLSGHLRSISGQLGALPTGARARLRRMDPEHPEREAGDVVALLLAAGVPEEEWVDRRGSARSREAADEGLVRWARACHLVATLAGAAGREAHAPVQDWRDGQREGDRRQDREAGRAIHAAGYSELRLMRLTAARGPALAAQVRRLARFLAAAGTGPVDLTPLADLLLWDGRDDDRADRARMEIARSYYRAAHEAERRPGTKGTP